MGGMFERTRDYPAAVTSDDLDWADADRLAVHWVATQHAAVGGQVLLLYPTARQRGDHHYLDVLEGAPGVVTTTWRSMLRAGWSGGPVLAAWPDSQHLSEIADDRRTRSLCVLTWNMTEVAPWASAVGAEVLGGNEHSLPVSGIGEAVVRRAMRSVTGLVNMNNTLKGGGHEKDVAAGALLILKAHGHKIDPTELYTWAVGNGWPARRAEELRDLATQIASGSRPRVRRGMFRTDVYERWSESAAEESE